MYRRYSILILLILVFASGCANIRGTDQAANQAMADKKLTLAVLPFHSAPDARDSGRIVADILANQLYGLNQYNIVAPEVVDERLMDQEGEALSPAKAGELVHAPYIVAGSVTEYTYKSGVGETPVVGLTARLIRVSDGVVLWSATRTGVGGNNWFQESSLSRITVMICKDIASEIGMFLQKYLLTGDPNQDDADASINGGGR